MDGLRYPVPDIGVMVRSSVLKLGHPHHSGIRNDLRGYLKQVVLLSKSFPSQSSRAPSDKCQRKKIIGSLNTANLPP